MASKMMKVAFLLPALAASIRINEEALKLTELELLGMDHGKIEEPLQQVAAVQQGATEDPQPEDECALAVPAKEGSPAGVRRNSAWRRSNKCKCPKDANGVAAKLQCPGQDCENFGRYFTAGQVKDKGCSCRTDCATNCEDIVEGATWRASSWRRSEKCKCAEGQVVGGSREACANHGSRYFRKAQLRDQGCSCQPDGEVNEGETPAQPPAQVPTPAQVPPTDNNPAPTPYDEEKPPANDDKDPLREEQQGKEGGATRMAGGLAASVVLAALAACA